MNKKGPQSHMLAVQTGSLNQPTKSDDSGLLDVIRLKVAPKSVYYYGFLACIDNMGNPFIFYHDKNRYINIAVPSPALQIAYIERKDGQLAIALKNNAVQIISCQNGRNLKTLKPQQHSILNIHVNHAKNLLLVVTMDACVLYSLDGFDKVHSLFAKSSLFINACFMPSSTELATLFQDKSLAVWNLSSFEVLWRITIPENVKQSQMLPSLEGNKLIINCSKIYIIDENSNVNCQSLQPGYGCSATQIKSVKKGRIYMLTRNHMLISIDSSGRVLTNIQIMQGKQPTYFDVFQDRLAVVNDAGEILIYDTNKIKRLTHDSQLGDTQNMTIKENYPDTLNLNNTTNVDIKKVGCSDTVFQTSQSTVKRNSKSMSQSQPYNSHTIGKSMKNTNDPLKELMNHSKLQQFIKHYNVFPDDKRSLSWRSLLDLPMNQEAYNNLNQQGIHPAFARLSEKFNLQSESLFSRLQRTLSCLAWYCPLFAELDYLPALVFPFVKLFKRGEELFIFETCLSILVQLCQKYYENFPQAPIPLLLFHDQVLQQVDPQLAQHLKQLGFQSVKYVWPNLKNLYTELLNKEQWLQLMDNLIVYNYLPQLSVLFFVEYLRYFRTTILRMNEQEQLEIFFNRQNTVEISKLIEKTLQLSNQLDYDDYHLVFQNQLPLQKDQYQIYNLYPKNSVMYQAKIREQIEEDEKRIYQKQQQIRRLEEMSEQLQGLDQLFKEKQELTLQVQRDRQEFFDYQTEMRAQKNFQQENQVRQNRIKQIETLEKTMKDSLQNQMHVENQEQQYLNQQFQKAQMADNLRLQSIQEEEALQNIEFQIFQKFSNFMQERSKQENQRQIQAELEFKQKQKELADQIKTEQWKSESQEQQIRRETIKQARLQELQEMQNQTSQEEADYQQMIQQFQQDLKMIQLEREKKLRDMLQQEEFQKQEERLKKNPTYDKSRSLSYQRRQQMEQQLNQLAIQHQQQLKIQEQQLLEQMKQRTVDSSQDVREPMTSQKQSSGVYDDYRMPISSQKRSYQSPSMYVEEEKQKFLEMREQLQHEIGTLQHKADKAQDEDLKRQLRDREAEIFKRTQQIRNQINQDIDKNCNTMNSNLAYSTGQFQNHYSPKSSQFSLYQPDHDVELDQNQLSESQLTYSSGFTSPGQRY